MRTTAIIVAAGKGQRFKSNLPKAFVPLNKIPMFEHSIRAFQEAASVSEIILVKPPSHHLDGNKYFDRYSKLSAIVSGGKERLDSVRAGLRMVSSDSGIALIHDAARPLIGPEQIEEVIRAVKKHGAAILASPVTDTIKQARAGLITGTLDRSQLWKAQTPQGFKMPVLKKTHFTRKNPSATDDSQLVEMVKGKVHIVPGDDRNIKITTPVDLEIASWLLKKRR